MRRKGFAIPFSSINYIILQYASLHAQSSSQILLINMPKPNLPNLTGHCHALIFLLGDFLKVGILMDRTLE